MKNGLVLFLLCATPMVSWSADNSKVPVVAVDSKGKTTVVEISAKDYSTRYKATVYTMSESLVEAVNLTANNNQQWHLRTITVGIGVNMELGVGTMKIGAVPKSRLMFTNSTRPALP